MKLYILKHSRVLDGFYTSIMCCVAGSKEEAIVDLLVAAGKYFDAVGKESYFFNWSGEACYFGNSLDELTETARIKLDFLNALKEELEADLLETDKPYIGVTS